MGLDKRERAELKAKKERERRHYRRKLKEEVRRLGGWSNIVKERKEHSRGYDHGA